MSLTKNYGVATSAGKTRATAWFDGTFHLRFDVVFLKKNQKASVAIYNKLPTTCCVDKTYDIRFGIKVIETIPKKRSTYFFV